MILNILLNIERNPIDFFDFYIFLFVAIILIIVKLNSPGYLKKSLTQFNYSKQGKAENFQELIGFSINSILLNISYTLLISLGFYNQVVSEKGFSSFIPIFLLVLGFYLIQICTYFVFEKMTETQAIKTSFLRYRLFHNELISIILFPVLLIINYSKFELDWLFIVMLLIFQVVNMSRTTTYLTRYVTTFHIILYLCTSEIVLLLFLIKYILKINS